MPFFPAAFVWERAVGGIAGGAVWTGEMPVVLGENGEDRVGIGYGSVIVHGVDAAQNDQQHQRQCQHGGGNEFSAQPLDHGFFSSEYPAFRVKVSAGAGFIVVQTGNIMTMPGLPKVPAAERIDIDADGKITGLF